MIGFSMPTKPSGLAMYVVGSFLVGASLAAVFFAHENSYGQYVKGSGPIREIQNTYALIDPLIACDVSEDKESESLIPLGNEIKNDINEIQDKGLAGKVSVYFRDLNTGQWT